ncbi:MAG: 2Fe-2S iron-sulfur cluster-binding protein [Endomicrobia bacterium]|nr:2Fe-2S iron-sulfur cluster-binding protein [Endomicrobiia bacterium]
MIRLNIDNNQIEIEENKTVLEAAKSAGIDIPTLCYHPALEPYGACRLCIVEITKEQWRGWSRLVVSCAYPAENNLIVYTKSDRVIKARKFVLELLLTRCPEVETIRELACEYGINESRFASIVQQQKDNKCILCGLCVRVCSEIVGESAISFTHRGINRKILPPFGKPSEVCTTCGACAFVCPTGAIRIEDTLSKHKVSISQAETELVKCKNCSKYFIPFPVSKKISLKLPEFNDWLNLCPKCRRKNTILQITDAGSVFG